MSCWYLNMTCWRVRTDVWLQVVKASRAAATADSISLCVDSGTRVTTCTNHANFTPHNITERHTCTTHLKVHWTTNTHAWGKIWIWLISQHKMKLALCSCDLWDTKDDKLYGWSHLICGRVVDINKVLRCTFYKLAIDVELCGRCCGAVASP